MVEERIVNDTPKSEIAHELPPPLLPRQRPWWHYGLIGLGIVVVLIALKGDGAQTNMDAFKDNPAKVKGVLLRCSVKPDHDELGENVRSYYKSWASPQDVWDGGFRAWTGRHFFPVRLAIPRELADSVPNADHNHDLMVTFRCTSGHIGDGNLIVSIKRP